VIDNLIGGSDKTLLETMHIINESGKGVCFIVDDSNMLIGIVTDGDIRRSILSGISLDSSISEIVSSNFVCGRESDSHEYLFSKLSEKVNIIPIVDDNNKVVDYLEYAQSIHFPVATPVLSGNEFKYLTDAFCSTWISSSGSYIDKFEDEFSKYSDCAYGSAVSNGTVALHLALVALEIGIDDEVIIPDLTFAATINAVLHAHATPVIVDVEEDSWCISPQEVENAITSKTKAIIPVHLYGQPCDMDAIMKIAKKYKLKVIEDCAQAHGAMFKNQKVGSFGDIGCFSFYGNKVLTTGEGGMCTTNNPILNKKMRILRDHGMSREKRYWHDVVGFNYRMTNLQAAIGVAQLERIESIHKNRREYENCYRAALSKKNFTFQNNLDNRQRITWLVSFLIDKDTDREEYIDNLRGKGMDARPFFYPLSDMEIYKEYCCNSTPVTKKIASLGLNLPTYESLKSITEIDSILSNA
jgi:perosamine synthetase